jgi:ribonuclease VapC
MTAAVFDASAVVAVLRNEAGARFIVPYCSGGVLSTVNLQEAIKILRAGGFSQESVAYLIDALRFEIVPHSMEDAYQAAELVNSMRQYGSSIGDRTCMALGISRNLPVLTTNRAWMQLSIPGLKVLLAR